MKKLLTILLVTSTFSCFIDAKQYKAEQSEENSNENYKNEAMPENDEGYYYKFGGSKKTDKYADKQYFKLKGYEISLSKADENTANIVLNYLKNSKKSQFEHLKPKKEEILVDTYDLDGDGEREIIYVINNVRGCPISGCFYEILKKNKDKYDLILLTKTNHMIKILRTKTNGFQNIKFERGRIFKMSKKGSYE